MKKDGLDEIDLQILNLLQKKATTSNKVIAEKVHLSQPAVSARVNQMEEKGYIRGYHAIINPQAFGYQIKAFINLEVEPAQKKTFYPFIESVRNVIECNCVTGDYSMLLEVLLKTTDELDLFIGELQNYGRTKTLMVFSTSVEHRGIMLGDDDL